MAILNHDDASQQPSLDKVSEDKQGVLRREGGQ